MMSDSVKKKKKKKKLTKAGRAIVTMILIGSLGVAGYSGCKLWEGMHDYKVTDDAYNELLKEVEWIPDNEETEYVGVWHANFEKAAEINPEIVGWITLDDSRINYPIVQHSDNEYYLTHLFDGSEYRSGCIFMDYLNSSDWSDKNTAIYGHHMFDGSMFADLEKYRSQEWYETHTKMRLQTPAQEYVLEPFAGVATDGYEAYVEIGFASDEDFLNYVNDKISRSTFSSNVEVTAEDQIVLMSTCSYNVEEGRYVVFAKMTKAEETKPE